MSDTEVTAHHGHGHADGASVKRVPLMMAVGMVLFTLCVVAFASLTGKGVVHTGANEIVTAGHVQVARDAEGTIHVLDAATKEVVASYPQSREQFLAGALRSLERMRPAVDESTRTFAVLRIGNGRLVFLEDIKTGDLISLNAFNRAKSQALASRVAALNGGQQ